MTRKQVIRTYEWFIENNEGRLNETLARGLDESIGAEFNYHAGLLCEDGQKRHFWQCSRQVADYLWRSRDNLQIENLQIWSRAVNKDTSKGPLRNVTFLFRKGFGGRKQRRRKTR